MQCMWLLSVLLLSLPLPKPEYLATMVACHFFKSSIRYCAPGDDGYGGQLEDTRKAPNGIRPANAQGELGRSTTNLMATSLVPGISCSFVLVQQTDSSTAAGSALMRLGRAVYDRCKMEAAHQQTWRQSRPIPVQMCMCLQAILPGCMPAQVDKLVPHIYRCRG